MRLVRNEEFCEKGRPKTLRGEFNQKGGGAVGKEESKKMTEEGFGVGMINTDGPQDRIEKRDTVGTP